MNIFSLAVIGVYLLRTQMCGSFFFASLRITDFERCFTYERICLHDLYFVPNNQSKAVQLRSMQR
jgi:hypothetical protein